IPDEPRDASSGAIIASALIELSDYTGDRYMQQALHILDSLAGSAYTAKEGENGHFVLMHSVGSIPHGNEIDVPINYADYYYIEALSRLREKGL
ncbi:glucuronyl hydrolase, partial [Sinomicrobium sp. FJxs]|nr:glucuronyl hydrolase [Sinomicrobium weinanense]